MTITRIAVLGLYNSGSTAVAGMLHRLGVNMGPPYYTTCDPDDEYNFYEPYDLSWHLRHWWSEPELREQTTAAQRIEFLKRWVHLQECLGHSIVGAKHPLLSLCSTDLLTAWGTDTKFIWCWRPLEESIEKLKSRVWFEGLEEAMQSRLWDVLSEFEESHRCVIRLDWNRLKRDPIWAVSELSSILGIQPEEHVAKSAAEFIKPEQTHHGHGLKSRMKSISKRLLGRR
jgi:hypothetical protein